MITHIVHLGFAPEVTETEQRQIAADLLALKSSCLRKDTQETYIVASTGGKNNSPEPYSNGLSHSFVVTFESAEDRDWYKEDPVHLEFQKTLMGKVIAVTVLAFEPGVF